MKIKILDFLSRRGTLLEPEAMNYLLTYDDPINHLSTIWKNIKEDTMILSIKDILLAEEVGRSAAQLKTVNARDCDAEFKLLRDCVPSKCNGKLEDFTSYFENRFNTLKTLLMRRRELTSCIDLSKIDKTNGELKFIGLVNSISTTKKGHRILEIEDENGRIMALIPNSSELIGDPTVQDEVVGIVSRKTKDLVIVDNIVRPEHPINKNFRTAEHPLLAVFISDLHVGSKHFLYEDWKRFSSWLRSEPSIKYLVIAGDLIDGIGIYPKQEEDLQIEDIYSQYEELAKLINEIPEHIKIVMIPGNHDAVRPAEPQHPLPHELRNLFRPGIEFLGNPSFFQISGVSVMAYHGRSIDDFVGQMASASYDRPVEIMKAMLQKRHLAPIYGGKTPISPEKVDHLVIDHIPDIFVTGHVHSVGLESYRGIRLINASTWQSQTEYQKMRNIHPVPCKAVVVNLGTGESWINDFLTLT